MTVTFSSAGLSRSASQLPSRHARTAATVALWAAIELPGGVVHKLPRDLRAALMEHPSESRQTPADGYITG